MAVAISPQEHHFVSPASVTTPLSPGGGNEGLQRITVLEA